MRKIKPEIRILGIDDAPFKRQDKEVLCIAVVYRGGNYIDGLLSFYVKKDGKDATDKIISTIKKTRHKEQLQLIMLDGINVAGFNMIDIQKIYKATKLPVMVCMRKKPKMKKFKTALSRIDKTRINLIEKAGNIYRIKINRKDKQKNKKHENKKDKVAYVQLAGLQEKQAREILKITCTNSDIPEPLRVAHLIAQGLVLGESKGGA